MKSISVDDLGDHSANGVDEPVCNKQTRCVSNSFKKIIIPIVFSILSSISCGNDRSPIGMDIPDAEQEKDLRKNVATLYNDGIDWYFDGNYFENFILEAKENGVFVLSTIITIDSNNNFYFTRPFGKNASRIDIQAYRLVDGNKDQEIIISSNPPPDGMYGVPWTEKFGFLKARRASARIRLWAAFW
ncbi:hypothetical protein KBB06_04770 [Candidatus Gracilibacteria bacterium]|nr:hypothetical protein [Candidatus Gracilibacteria bacterium]